MKQRGYGDCPTSHSSWQRIGVCSMQTLNCNFPIALWKICSRAFQRSGGRRSRERQVGLCWGWAGQLACPSKGLLLPASAPPGSEHAQCAPRPSERYWMALRLQVLLVTRPGQGGARAGSPLDSRPIGIPQPRRSYSCRLPGAGRVSEWPWDRWPSGPRTHRSDRRLQPSLHPFVLVSVSSNSS